MSAATDRIDAEIARCVRDRARTLERIEGKLAEVARMRAAYADSGRALDGYLDDRRAVLELEARAAIERDAAALAAEATAPPPTPPPAPQADDPDVHTGVPLPTMPTQQRCTCTAHPMARGLPCPRHGRPRPSTL